MDKVYVKFISSDDQAFYLEERIAKQCPYFNEQLTFGGINQQGGISHMKFDNLSGEVLEIVITYLHFREKYSVDMKAQIPQFKFKPEIANEVLKATQFLKI